MITPAATNALPAPRTIGRPVPLSRKDEVCRKVIEAGILALIVWTPLPLASVHEWSILIIEIAALALVGVYLTMDRPPRPNSKLAVRLRWSGLAFAGFLVFLGAQIAPLPEAVVRILSPHGAALRAAYVPASAPGPATLSLLPGRTLAAALEFAAYLLIGLVVVRTLNHRRQFRRIFTAFVAMGTFEALYGLFETMRRNPRLLFYQKDLMLDSATGTFVNRNHFSGYLELILPLAVGLILSRLDVFADPALKWRDRLVRLAGRNAAVSVLVGIGLVVMAIAILRSRSRSGTIVLAAIFILFFGLTTWHYGKSLIRSALILRVLKISLLVILVLSLYVGLESTISRFSWDGLLHEGRPRAWGRTLTMFSDFPLFGVGLGAFGEVFQAYDVMGMEYALVHAHNDYLEFLAELGFIGFALLGGAVFFLVGDAYRTWLKRRHPEIKGLALGGLVSIAALLLHGLSDFNLRIPANALAITMVLSLTLAVVYHRKS